MTNHNVQPDTPAPVSPQALEAFDAAVASVEDAVLRRCIADDHPEATMGPEAMCMIKSGLGFTSKLLRTIMVYGTGKIIENQMAWVAATLPGYGVSMTLIMNNFERYDEALGKIVTAAVYDEIRPHLADIIQRQRTLVKDTDGTDAG